MDRRVFDCFTFFNELELLDLRFCELYDEVDFFVLCESTLTFTGKPKPLHFSENKARFQPYLDKVIHVIVDDFPETSDPWVREYFQREAVRRGLGDAREDDLIIITDADEIINPRAIKDARGLDGHIQFNMNMYQYYMNLLGGQNNWTAPFGFTWKYREKLPDFSRARWVKDEVEAAFPYNMHRLDDAGWHFTHLGGIERLHQKFDAYSHADDPWPKAMKNKAALEKQIRIGGAVGETKTLADYVPIDASFPQSMIVREEYYRQLGFIKDIYQAFKELQVEYQEIKKSYAVQVYDDHCSHPALGGLSGKEFLTLSGVENPYEGKIIALPQPDGQLLSVGKPASQSSICEWSRGDTIEEDAGGAVDGRLTGEGKFHTDFDNPAWWMVDLQNVSEIKEIRIFNRLLPLMPDDSVIVRSARLKIELGLTPASLREVYIRKDSKPFGGVDGRPLIVKFLKPAAGRFVRISLLDPNYMHLDQVQVYGEKIN